MRHHNKIINVITQIYLKSIQPQFRQKKNNLNTKFIVIEGIFTIIKKNYANNAMQNAIYAMEFFRTNAQNVNLIII